MHKNFYELNDYLSQVLQKGQPTSILRIDNTAGYIIDSVLRNRSIVGEFFNPRTILEGGIFPNTPEYAINVAYKKTFESMINSDCVGFVDISGDIKKDSPLLQYLKDKVTFFKDGFMVFDPGAILGYSKLYLENLEHSEYIDPWTRHLKNKRVLVISTHAESIKHQWEHRHKVWGDRLELIVPFDLVDVIRAPYHPEVDSRQYPNCETWEDSVNYICKLIESYDFDVLLSGSTTSSPIFVQKAKSIGKIGIQTGGVIQLYFGLKGGRWAKVPAYSDWHKMFNEHWIYPLKIDEPQNKLQGIESNFAYWG
jgi:hypothetical protein